MESAYNVRCLYPRTVGFLEDGKTITWSSKRASKQYAPFQLPCSKCIECRLEYARQWAIRCVHEAKMHQQNSFITLTYTDEHLKSPKLQYSHFQLFMKRLRKTQNEPIGYFVTGEYGELRKRPHWHAILFNYAPLDLTHKRTNHRGDSIYTSIHLEKIWGKGMAEIGSVTLQSAGYCARYAAKKLIHGTDQQHEFHPISRKSNQNAIGKRFLEKYWPDIFNYGHVILEDGQKTSIPRYYEKWLKKHQPDAWFKYITLLKAERTAAAEYRAQQEKLTENEINEKRLQNGKTTFQITKETMQKSIIEQKFQILQGHLKGDI